MRLYLILAMFAAAPAIAVEPALPPLAQAVVPATPATPEARYASLRIVRPEHEETIHDNTGTVPVDVLLRPALRAQAGHRFRVLLDGVQAPGEWRSAHFSLHGIERGTHTVQVIVTDADGRRLAESAPVEFHLWQASRLFPHRQSEK
jgi:hypothetical protein